MIPSWTASKMFLEEMGKKWPMSSSLYKTELTWLEKASFSESKTVWITLGISSFPTYIYSQSIFISKIYLDFKLIFIFIRIMLAPYNYLYYKWQMKMNIKIDFESLDFCDVIRISVWNSALELISCIHTFILIVKQLMFFLLLFQIGQLLFQSLF